MAAQPAHLSSGPCSPSWPGVSAPQPVPCSPRQCLCLSRVPAKAVVSALLVFGTWYLDGLASALASPEASPTLCRMPAAGTTVMAQMELCPPPTPPVSTSAPVIHWAPTGETAGGWHLKGAVVGQGRGRCDEEDHGKAVLTSAWHGVPAQSCLVPALKQSPGSGPCTLGQAEAC